MPSIRSAAAAALALLAAAPATAQPAQLVVQVWSFGFAPQPIHLRAGRAVILTFVNQSGSSHDFVAPGFFQHSRIVAGGGSMEMGRMSGSMPMSMVDLRPHETKSVTLIPARGTWQAHCSHFLHKQMGMSDTIVVD